MFDTVFNTLLPSIWCHVCFALGLLGNGWLLVGTVRYRAVHLDKISVWILQNMALVDVASCLAVLLPVIITQYRVGLENGSSEIDHAFSLYGSWTKRSDDSIANLKGGNNSTQYSGWSPSALCEAVTIYEYSFLAGNLALMSMFSLNKLTRCMFPFRNTNPGRKQLAGITLLAASLSTIPAVWQTHRYCIPGLYPDMYLCDCVYGRELPSWYWGVGYLLGAITASLPFTVMVIANISLVTLAVRKSRLSLRKPGVYLCLGLTLSLTIAYMPTIIHFITLPIEQKNTLLGFLGKIRWNLSFVSCWISPVLCLLTNQRFRSTTIRLLRCNGLDGRGTRREDKKTTKQTMRSRRLASDKTGGRRGQRDTQV